VIRDGVMPPPGTRRIRMLAPDARTTLDARRAVQGRPIRLVDRARSVQLASADAMEFHTYTWGPASFPHEVRELYGILTTPILTHSSSAVRRPGARPHHRQSAAPRTCSPVIATTSPARSS
jgi:hypothetical protein